MRVIHAYLKDAATSLLKCKWERNLAHYLESTMLITCQVTLVSLLWLSSTVSAGKRLSKTNTPGALNVPRRQIVHQNRNNGNNSSVSLEILTRSGQRNATAPLLYGWMFEDINHSGDGGLYGELLTNRGLEGSNIEWGIVPDFPYNSIVGQENECLAGGL